MPSITTLPPDTSLQPRCHLFTALASPCTAALTPPPPAAQLITKLMTLEEARDSRDALSKTIYAGIFSWIVDRINDKLDTTKGKAGGPGEGGGERLCLVSWACSRELDAVVWCSGWMLAALGGCAASDAARALPGLHLS